MLKPATYEGWFKLNLEKLRTLYKTECNDKNKYKVWLWRKYEQYMQDMFGEGDCRGDCDVDSIYTEMGRIQ